MRAASIVIRIVGESFPRCRFEEMRITEISGGKSARNAIDHYLFRVVRIDRTNDMAARIVVHFQFLAVQSVGWSSIVPTDGEERLVFLNHAALVVIDLPTTYKDVRVLIARIL